MRAVIQRVNSASVTVEGAVTAAIGRGLLVLVGITHTDGADEAEYLAEKTVNMRLFPRGGSESGFEVSALEAGAEILLVSQFTLYAGTRKGRRPSFTDAAPGQVAGPLFERVVERFRQTGLRTHSGIFGAHMHVALDNDGPVTITLDSNERFTPRDA